MKDREEVLSKSKLLKTANIYVSEDLSRKTREHRHELSKHMRFVRQLYTFMMQVFIEYHFSQIRRKAPDKKCVIRYDKLYIDNEPYMFDETEGKVVRFIPIGGDRALSPPRREDSRQERSAL